MEHPVDFLVSELDKKFVKLSTILIFFINGNQFTKTVLIHTRVYSEGLLFKSENKLGGKQI